MEKPKSTGTNYTKFAEGENPLRIVSEVISGWECWTHNEGHQVYRQEHQFKAIQLDDMGVEGKEQKQFYACIVWNYSNDQFECMVIKQSTIKQALYSLDQNEKWGNPNDYDLVITKTGSGMDTSYSVMPEPKSDFAKNSPEYNLEALYTGGNPLENE